MSNYIQYGAWAVHYDEPKNPDESGGRCRVVLSSMYIDAGMSEPSKTLLVSMIENKGRLEFSSEAQRQWYANEIKCLRAELAKNLCSRLYDLSGCLRNTDDGFVLDETPSKAPSRKTVSEIKPSQNGKKISPSFKTKAAHVSADSGKRTQESVWKYDEDADAEVLTFCGKTIRLTADSQELLIELVKAGSEGVSVVCLNKAFGLDVKPVGFDDVGGTLKIGDIFEDMKEELQALAGPFIYRKQELRPENFIKKRSNAISVRPLVLDHAKPQTPSSEKALPLGMALGRS